MLRNSLTIAYRSLRNHLGVSLLNIIGLAVGMAACLFIGLWVHHQFSYDDVHPNADRIYRVALEHQIVRDTPRKTSSAPAVLKAELARDVSGVEAVTGFAVRSSVVLQHRDRTFPNHRVLLTDSSFLDVFGGFRLLHGARTSALHDPSSVVLTAETARRVFGRTNVVGETVEMGDTPRRIRGVLADLPETSHVHFDAVRALGRLPAAFRENWVGFAFHTYVKLAPNTSDETLQATLDALERTQAAADIQDRTDMPRSAYLYEFSLQPLLDIHLHSDLDEEIQPTGSMGTVVAFGLIGVFILGIACINVVNLTTIRAAKRATEVGMRKALGAARAHLVGQFLVEALLLTGVAALLALAGVWGGLPAFNTLAGTGIAPGQLLQPAVLGGALVLFGTVALIAGGYPALAFAKPTPAAVLKSRRGTVASGGSRRLRQSGIVLQFAISIALIVSTGVVWEQFEYVQTKRLGLTKERVVTLQGAEALGERGPAFVERLARLPGVQAVGAGDPLFREVASTSFVPLRESGETGALLNVLQVGTGFVEVLQMDLAAGRTFDPSRPADSTGMLLNEAAVRSIGWTANEAVGRRIAEQDTFTVIGVVRDFHYQSMRQGVEPVALMMTHPVQAGSRPDRIYARIAPTAPGGLKGALDALRAEWRETVGAEPFQVAFLDQTYDGLHRDVQRAGRLFGGFAGLAVLLACLGLFGLAAFTVQRRAQEIGVRKALGATAAQIVGRFSAEFLKLVALAAVAALPLAALAMNEWLNGFAYRTDLGMDVLVGAVALAAAVAFLAISGHAFRAARLDPARTLRDG